MSTETAVVLHEAPPLPSLMDGPDPMLAIDYARKLSTALATVLSERNGYVTISGRKHVEIAGWTTLAAMTNHTCEVEWTRIVPDMADERGVQTWEARAVVRDGNGKVVATGESMADPSEVNAKGAPVPWRTANYSVRSMAATRAQVRAYASRLRYITVLAGMSGTPAEEMQTGDAAPTAPSKPTKTKARKPEAWAVRWNALQQMASDVDLSPESLKETLKAVGAGKPSDLSDEALYLEAMRAISGEVGGDVIEGEIVTEAEKAAALGLDNDDPPETPDTAQTILPSDLIAQRAGAAPGDA